MAKIRNMRGTSNLGCSCGTWIDHYHNHSATKATGCSVAGCDGPAALGAHVYYADGIDPSQYIVPMCHQCNSSDDDMPLRPDVTPAPVRSTLTGCA